MKRVWILAGFLVKNLFRSWAGLAPLAAMLGAYTITFSYQGQKVDYFAAVGGFDLALVCAVTTLSIAGQANRATLYPLVAKLRRHWELLAAVALASLVVTCLMALLFSALCLLQRTAIFTAEEFLIIVPRWLALFTLAVGISLHLSRLAGTTWSRILAALALIVVLGVADRQVLWQRPGLGWALDLAGVLAAPFAANMMAPVHGAGTARYALAVGLPLLAAVILSGAAAALFSRKDLLWVE